MSKQPTCPACGSEPTEYLIEGHLHGLAVCPSDDYPLLVWDPTRTARETLSAVEMIEPEPDSRPTA